MLGKSRLDVEGYLDFAPQNVRFVCEFESLASLYKRADKPKCSSILSPNHLSFPKYLPHCSVNVCLISYAAKMNHYVGHCGAIGRTI